MGTRVTFDNLTQLVTNEASAVETINQNFDDVETQIDDFVSRTGTGTNTMQVDWDMNNNKIINVGDGALSSDAVNKGQLSAASTFVGPSVSNGGTEVDAAPTDINFGDGLTAADDGDGTVTVSASAGATQSYFLARHQAADNQTNVTGDGTVYTPKFTNVVYNIGTDFNSSTTTYTAPVNGLYQFAVNIVLFDSGFTAAVEECRTVLIHSAHGDLDQSNWGDTDTARISSVMGNWIVEMSVGDTVTLQNECGGAAKSIDDTSTVQWFSGALLREI